MADRFSIRIEVWRLLEGLAILTALAFAAYSAGNTARVNDIQLKMETLQTQYFLLQAQVKNLEAGECPKEE